MGYHFVAYHGYASRRYYEMYPEDVERMGVCVNMTAVELKRGPKGTTCSWLKFDEKKVPKEEWFRGCLCYHFANRM